MIYRLDGYILNPREMTLKNESSGEIVSRDERLIEGLTLLVERYPDVVTKEELIKAVWPRQVVTDWSLTRFISDMRKTLGDKHHIKTVHGRGYRYTCPAEKLKAPENRQSGGITAPGADGTDDSKHETDQAPLTGADHAARPDDAVRSGSSLKSLPALACIMVALLIAVWFGFESRHRPVEVPVIGTVTEMPVIAVLPADHEGRIAIQLGLMALLSEKLDSLPGVQLVQPQAVLNAVRQTGASNTNPASPTGGFEQVCRAVACNRVIRLSYTRRGDSHAVHYRITSEQSSVFDSASFVAGHVMDAFGAAYQDLVNHLPVPQTDNIPAAGVAPTDNRYAYLIYAEALGAVADGDPARAMVNLKYAAEADGDFFQPRIKLAELYMQRNEQRAAEKLVDQIDAMTLTPLQQFSLNTLKTNREFERGNFEEALSYAEQARTAAGRMNNNKPAGNALLNKGIVLHARGNTDQARDAVTQARELFIDIQYIRGLARAEYCLGDIHRARGDETAARQAVANGNAVYTAAGLAGLRACTLDDALLPDIF